jgi:hypothetical protein
MIHALCSTVMTKKAPDMLPGLFEMRLSEKY